MAIWDLSTKCLNRFQSSKLLLAIASTGIHGSESHGTHDHILLSDGSGSLQTTPGTRALPYSKHKLDLIIRISAMIYVAVRFRLKHAAISLARV
jgi:hypothetical protein